MRKRYCDWCGYPKQILDHTTCVPCPDYHDHEAYWAWMKSPERPTRNSRRTMRALTDYEQVQLEEWGARQKYQNN